MNAHSSKPLVFEKSYRLDLELLSPKRIPIEKFIAALNAMQMKTAPAPSGSSTAGTSGKSAGFNFQDLNLLVLALDT